MKTNFLLGCLLLLLLSSCTRGSFFTHRKYTGGFFHEGNSFVRKTKTAPKNNPETGKQDIVCEKISAAEPAFQIAGAQSSRQFVPGASKTEHSFKSKPKEKTWVSKFKNSKILKNSIVSKSKLIHKATKKKSLYISPELAAVLKVIMIVLAVIAVALLIIYVFFYSELVAATANLLKISLAAVLLLILALIIIRKA